MQRSPFQKFGFSIIEILIVIGVIALGTLVIIPTFSNLTGQRLYNVTSDLGRLIRSTYSDAALSGNTFRIVFEMKVDEKTQEKTSTFWVEASKEEARGDELVKDEDEGVKFFDEREREKQKYVRKPEFLPLNGELGKKYEFPSSVRLFGVWVEGMPERKREGTVYLYFFPTGYTQKAEISLTDDEEGKNLMTLMTEPLTGEVVTGYEEKPLK